MAKVSASGSLRRLLVLLSFGLVLYVSRRNIIEDVPAPVPVHVNYEHKKKVFPSSFPDKHHNNNNKSVCVPRIIRVHVIESFRGWDGLLCSV